jgi:hypothetical protein
MTTPKIIKKREPLVERLTLPLPKSLFLRYRNAANELDKRELTKLHDLTRERLDSLLTEIEQVLAKSS